MTSQEEHYKNILARYLPEASIDRVYRYIVENAIHFKIAPQRSSKLGDYRPPMRNSAGSTHQITINGNLRPYMFLWVLIHEIAHLETFRQWGRRVQPHGPEWQESYRQLIQAWNLPGMFPESLRPQIARYATSRPLKRALLQDIEAQLSGTTLNGTLVSQTHLKDLPVGSRFQMKGRKDHLFQSEEKLRTRYRCIDLVTGTHYIISGAAEVVPLP